MAYALNYQCDRPAWDRPNYATPRGPSDSPPVVLVARAVLGGWTAWCVSSFKVWDRGKETHDTPHTACHLGARATGLPVAPLSHRTADAHRPRGRPRARVRRLAQRDATIIMNRPYEQVHT